MRGAPTIEVPPPAAADRGGERERRLINASILLVIASLLLHDALHWLFARESTGLIIATNLVAAAVMAGIPLLYRFGARLAGGVFIFLLGSYITFVAAAMGTDSGVHLYLLAGGCVVFLLPPRPLWALALTFAYLLAYLVLVLLLVPPGGFIVHAPPDYLELMTLQVSVTTAIVVFLVVALGQHFLLQAEAATEREFARSERLLGAILPSAIAQRLKDEPGALIALRYEQASVLFGDLVGFTSASAGCSPEVLVDWLDALFRRFDALAETAGVEKIKTMGDGYMVLADGTNGPAPPRLAGLALAMQEAMAGVPPLGPTRLQLRIGVATGPVVAGVIGARKFAFDVWSETVNRASRLETAAEAGTILVDRTTLEALGSGFASRAEGAVPLKGFGDVEAFRLIGKLA